jgi:hypothetical protein
MQRKAAGRLDLDKRETRPWLSAAVLEVLLRGVFKNAGTSRGATRFRTERA